jgi:hypothetical protein
MSGGVRWKSIPEEHWAMNQVADQDDSAAIRMPLGAAPWDSEAVSRVSGCLPVDGSFLPEYRRYSPDFSLRIMHE